jgi:CO/xanthine dehydrogenase FAD-binding subunit
MKESIWSIEASASLQAVLDHPDSPQLLRQTLTGVLAWQTRNETTIDRALRARRIAPEWVAALLALGAMVEVEAEDSSAEMPLETMIAEKATGAVLSLAVPVDGLGRRVGSARVARTPTSTPVATAFATLDLENGVVIAARVALTGVWPEAARLAEAPSDLIGAPLDRERVQAVADAVTSEVDPPDDFLGSAAYRRAMAGVLTRRALENCLEGGDA